MNDILAHLTEYEKIRYQERRAFFAKGYDENGKAQYLDTSDPFVVKTKTRHHTVALEGTEKHYYNDLFKAILDHNSAVYEDEKRFEQNRILDEEMQILEKKEKILDERMQILNEKMKILQKKKIISG